MPLRGYGQGYETLAFDLNDLIEPIPDSIYNRQHRCLVSQHEYAVSAYIGMGESNGEFSCARTGPYAPIIGVPPEVRALDPAWESCGGWYGGLFDRKGPCRSLYVLLLTSYFSSQGTAAC